MAIKPKAWPVSQLMSDDAVKRDEQNKNYPYKHKAFDDLIEAVGNELRDVKFSRIGHGTAVVYREGDVFALGEIGYKNTKSKGNGEFTYYVQSRTIANDKYKDTSWQHFIVSTKVLKNAVKAASAYLTPFNAKEMLEATKDAARQKVHEVVNVHNAAARQAYKDLTGEAGYSTNMEGQFIEEIRHFEFASLKLREARDRFFNYRDAWLDAKNAMAKGLYFVGVTDAFGQKFVDFARVDMSYPYGAEVFDRQPAESVADWVLGRLAVLSMVPMHTYVQGVGIRLDDRTYYIAGEEQE